MSDPQIHRPFEKAVPDVEGVPPEEGVSKSDALDRLDESPEEQKNFTETHGQRTQVNQPEPDTAPAPQAEQEAAGETGPRDREESIELDDPKYDDA